MKGFLKLMCQKVKIYMCVSVECVSTTRIIFPSVFSSSRSSVLTIRVISSCFSQSNVWASARVPTGSVPCTQSQKREVGTIALWPHARACWERVEREWKRVGLIDGWCGSECHGVVINNCQRQPMHPSLICEEQSCVYQSQCVLASLTNFMVLYATFSFYIWEL